MFRRVNALVQCCRRILIKHRHRLLADNGPGVHTGIDEMDGATGDFHALIQRLFPGFQSGEGGQQRGVNINDAAFKGAQKIALKHAHETGEDDQIHFRRLQLLHEGAFGVFVQFGAEFARRNELGGHVAFTGMGEDAGVFDIAQDDGDFRRNSAGRDGIGNGDKVGAFAGTENAETK